MREKTVETALVRQCKRIGALCIKLVPDYMAGLPDRMILFNGKCVFVELKAPGKTSRPIQRHVQHQIQMQGFDVFELDSVERVDAFVRVHLLREEVMP